MMSIFIIIFFLDFTSIEILHLRKKKYNSKPLNYFKITHFYNLFNFYEQHTLFYPPVK